MIFLIRKFSDISFYILEKRHKVKKNVQRYNFFVDRRKEKKVFNNLQLSKVKLDKIDRTIDRSLRTVVTKNEEQISAILTDEEKSLQLLAKQQ